jgi:glutamine synthetase
MNKDSYKAVYIWLDGTKPTAQLRSKTKIIQLGDEPPVWGFDGSSTNQAPGEASDCVLKPVFVCPDTSGKNRNEARDKLVLCEVYLPSANGIRNDLPHDTNTRRQCSTFEDEYKKRDTWFGFEQEYTLLSTNGTPIGFYEGRKTIQEEFAVLEAQGPYYCSVGVGYAVGRDVAEEHLDACLRAGLKISGINAEVMPGQWEFQIGPANALEASDHLWVARWLLHKIAERHNLIVSFDAKPAKGDWNGAGCHTNFSTKKMRGPYNGSGMSSYQYCIAAAEALGERHNLHIENYGHGIEDRLTGEHETCSYKEYRYGASDRGASVRIPWQVEKNKRGYLEDRRPNANCDPYIVSGLILDAVCSSERSAENAGHRPPY